MKIVRSVVGVVLLFIACNSPTRNNRIASANENPGKKEEVNIVLTKVLNPHANPLKVNVDYDQYFNAPKKYLGFSLPDLLDSSWKAAGFDTANALVLFECKDGYNPIMDLSKAYGPVKGYIVFKDLDLPDNKDWPDSLVERFRPYYLVWDRVKMDDKSFFWPYGLTAIKLISQQEKYKLIAPDNNNPAYQGFVTFKDNCIKCHSINKIGGSFGPEFNIPKNITEYWDAENIVSFAKTPAAFRYNSRMPAMGALSDKEFENILLYLKYMKGHKYDH